MPLPDPFIVGFSGPAGVGKDTAADHLVRAHGFHRFAFADPLREMLFALLEQAGVDHAWATEPHLKEQPIPGLGVSYRHLAQTLGTEWARQQLGADFWLRVASMALGLSGAGGHVTAPIHDRIVIPDVRFPDEAAWITAQGGVVIRISRPVPGVRPHISEQLLDHIEPWAVVPNHGPITELHHRLDALMQQLFHPEQPLELTAQA